LRRRPIPPYTAHGTPVLIRHRLIVCNVSGSAYLVQRLDAATFTLGCARFGSSPRHWPVHSLDTDTVQPGEPAMKAAIQLSLTAAGRLLLNFEELLWQAHRGRPLHAYCSGNRTHICSEPCRQRLPYWYLFKVMGRSQFLVTKLKVTGVDFGPVEAPMSMHGNLIACDTTERRFLVMYSTSATFTLGCLVPVHSLTR